MQRGTLTPAPQACRNLLAGLLLYLALPASGDGSEWSTRESPGPAAPNTGLVITEIMYNPADRLDGRNLEFVEIYNSNPFAQDLTGYTLSGETLGYFPPGFILPATSHVIVARSPLDIQAVYGITNPIGQLDKPLGGTGTLVLNDRYSRPLLEVSYSDNPPWPSAADGPGHSLVLTHPSRGQNNPGAWSISDAAGGSPGRADPQTPDPLKSVVINEFLAASELPFIDYIELFNTSTQSLDLAGCVLSDSKSNDKFVFGPGSIIPARGFLAVDEFVVGFGLSRDRGTLYFRSTAASTNGHRVLDEVQYQGQARRVASGRYPDGAPGIKPLIQPTPLAPNTPPAPSQVVINEIMYHPISGNPADEYIELFNTSTNEVRLDGWRITGAISFSNSTSIILPPLGYVVIARDAEHLIATHPQLNALNTIGNYTGSLFASTGGHRNSLNLLRAEIDPDALDESIFLLEDSATFGLEGGRNSWAGGGGSSSELIDPRSDRQHPSNWAPSQTPPSTEWTLVETTGTLDHGAGPQPNSEIQILALAAGEYLVDDVEVLVPEGPNLVSNGGFESGADGWIIQGNHVRSTVEPAGFTGNNSLRLRSSGPGDPGANHVESELPVALTNGSATIRARVKWLHGHPAILLRLYGNYLEAAQPLAIPPSLGTPGQINSRHVPNSGPTIEEVQHRPFLPAPQEPVLISARLSDPDGLTPPQLTYRIDPSTTVQHVAMNDEGLDGDSVAGDGLYSATIPGQPAGAIAAYTLSATDNAFMPATRRFPADPGGECLVRFGEQTLPGNFGDYRIWITSGNAALLATRARSSDEPVRCTFVYSKDRIVHDAGLRYGGVALSRLSSSSVFNALSCVIHLPADQTLLDRTTIELDGVDPNVDPTGLRELTAFRLAGRMGLPTLHHRFVHLIVNGVTETQRGIPVFFDRQTPGSRFLKAGYPSNPSGQLFGAAEWHEFTDGADPLPELVEPARLLNYTSTSGGKKQARYRWNWRKQEHDGVDDNYDFIFNLVDAFQVADHELPGALDTWIDLKQWLDHLAMRHVLGDGEGYGYDRGQNVVLVKPDDGPAELLFSRLKLALGAGGGHPPTHDLFRLEPGETSLQRLYNLPHLRRIYSQALLFAADLALVDGGLMDFLDRRHQALQNAGANVLSPFLPSGAQGLSLPGWLEQRRAYIKSQFPFVPLSVATNEITFSGNLAIVEGTAPIEGSVLYANNTAYPVTWITPTRWRMPIPLGAGSNQIHIRQANLAESVTVNIDYSGSSPDPRGFIVINEILPNPLAPDPPFVEIHNRHPSHSFLLKGWVLENFPFGSPFEILLTNGGYLVLTSDREAFAASYGASIPALDTLGPLHPTTGLLTLHDERGSVIDQLRYGVGPPWPSTGTIGTTSLQTIDPSQDTRRPGNWAAAEPTPGRINSTHSSLPPVPSLWLSELQLLNGTGLTDDDDQAEPWLELYNAGSNTVSLDGISLAGNYDNINPWSFPPASKIAPGEFKFIWLDNDPPGAGEPTPHAAIAPNPLGGVLSLSWNLTNRIFVLDHLDYPAGSPETSFGSFPDGDPIHRITLEPTPSGPNRKPRPTVAINEWMASNGTFTDPADGDQDDWFELYNAGTNAVDLSNHILEDQNNTFTIPDGVAIPARGFLLVWADGESGQFSPTRPDLHVTFGLGRDQDAIRLLDPDGTPIDEVVFRDQVRNVSEGRYPDGFAAIGRMPNATPGGANTLPIAFRPRLLSPASPIRIQATVGETIQLTTVTTGSSPIISLRWWHDQTEHSHEVVPPGTNVLILPSVGLEAAGTYSLQLSSEISTNSPLLPVAIVSVLEDNDNDTMADAWEIEHGLNPTQPSDALEDLDGDGSINRDEHAARTDPADPDSHLRLELARSGEGGSVIIRFRAGPNASYSVQSIEKIGTDTWTPVAGFSPAVIGQWKRVTNSTGAPDMPGRYFRVVTPASP